MARGADPFQPSVAHITDQTHSSVRISQHLVFFSCVLWVMADPTLSSDCCDSSICTLYFKPSQLRHFASTITVGQFIFVRFSSTSANESKEDEHLTAAAYTSIPVIVQVLLEEQQEENCLKSETGDNLTISLVASKLLESYFRIRPISTSTKRATASSLRPPALQLWTTSINCFTLPKATLLILRPRFESSRRPPSSISSLDFLATSSFLASVLFGRIAAVGTRLSHELLRRTYGIEYFEVVELQLSTSNLESEFPAVRVITNLTTISLVEDTSSTPLLTSSLPALDHFPTSIDQWMQRIRQHVYGYEAILTQWLETIWFNVNQFQTEVESSINAASTMFPLSKYSPHTFLLHGLSGTGKSHICRTLAGTSGLPYFFLHSSALFQRVEGASETGLVQVFQSARNCAQPCIIILDEIDTILPKKRSEEEALDEVDEEGVGAGLKQESHVGWEMGNSRIEWRMASVLKELLQEINGIELPSAGDSSSPTPPIYVFFTTSSPSSLDACGLRLSPYIDEEFELKALHYEERIQALQIGMKTFRFAEAELEQKAQETQLINPIHQRADIRTLIFERIASELHGFVGADIHGFIREVLLAALKRTQLEFTQLNSISPADIFIQSSDYQSVLQWFHPSNLQQIEFRLPPSSTVTSTNTALLARSDQPLPFSAFEPYFASLAGITPLLRHLHFSFLLPIKQPHLYANWKAQLGMRGSKGVLIYGPSGTGKTSLSLALAHACGLNAMVVPATSLVSKVLGSAEKSLARIFATARASSPSLLIFDQLEMIAPIRKGLIKTGNKDEDEAHEVDSYERILSVLLIEMDGVLGKDDREQVYIVGTSSRPDLIDPALLRPSRLDSHIQLPPPDQPARLEILQLIMTKTPILVELDEEGKIVVPNELAIYLIQLDASLQQDLVQWNSDRQVPDSGEGELVPSSNELRAKFFRVLSYLTVGFSGADLVSLQRESAMHALRSNLATRVVRTWRDLVQGALLHMKGSLNEVTLHHPFGRQGEWFASEHGAAASLDHAPSIFTKKSKADVAARNALNNLKVGARLASEPQAAAPIVFSETPFTMANSTSTEPLPSEPFVFSMGSTSSAPSASLDSGAFVFDIPNATSSDSSSSTPAFNFSIGSVVAPATAPTTNERKDRNAANQRLFKDR